MRPLAISLLLLAASTALADAPKAQRIVNLGYFDLASCDQRPPALPGAVDDSALLGLLVAARPSVMECLVPPTARGPAKQTTVSVDSRLEGGKVVSRVTGENVTPAGAACATAALDRYFAAAPRLAARGAAAKAHTEIQHVAEVNPTVTLGVNEASDVAAAVRLALPSSCECFAAWKGGPPRALEATLTVERPKPGAPAGPLRPTATVTATGDAAADRVGACLGKKLAEITVRAPSGQSLRVPLPLRFVSSEARGPLGAAPPDLQFTQLDLERGRRSAEAAIAIGHRTGASTRYNDLVTRFKGGARPPVTLPALQEGCAALLHADDGTIAALEAQRDVEERTLQFTVERKAKESGWAQAEAAAREAAGRAAKDVETLKKTRVQDAGACPKVRAN